MLLTLNAVIYRIKDLFTVFSGSYASRFLGMIYKTIVI